VTGPCGAKGAQSEAVTPTVLGGKIGFSMPRLELSTAPNTCIELERARKIEQEYARQLLEIGDSPVQQLGMADILMEQVLITEKKLGSH
jgi:hypothetical protein